LHDIPRAEPIADNPNIQFHIFLPPTPRALDYVELHPKNKRVVIENAFPVQRRNADYPKESFFSSLYLTHKEHFIGFGDFTIQIMDYIPSDGADAKTISPAIHLTYIKNKFIFVRHYTTTPTENPNFKNRIIETIDKVLCGKKLFYYSSGIKDLEDKQGQSTSLAKFKEIGMKHHIDFVSNLIKS
jgi:hypothetical protein